MVARATTTRSLGGTILFLAGMAFSASGQTQVPHHFHDLEQRVLQQGASVNSLAASRDALNYKLQAVRSSYLPQISANYRYYPNGFSFTEDDFGTSHLFSLRLSQDIFQLKTRSARTDQVRSQLTIAEQALSQGEEQALLAFRKSYIDVLEHRTRMQHYNLMAAKQSELLRIKEQKFAHHEELLTAVLKVETELNEYEGLAQYSRNAAAGQELLLEEYLDLKASDIAWDELQPPGGIPARHSLIKLALQQNNGLLALREEVRMRSQQARAAGYSGLRLAPFLGIRVRGDRFSALGTAPEVGFRFSLPLAFFQHRSNKSQQYFAEATALERQADEQSQSLRRRISSLYDRWLLNATRIRVAQKEIEARTESLRIVSTRAGESERLYPDQPEQLARIQIGVYESQLDNKVLQYERTRLYYELLAQCGLRWQQELPEKATEIRTSSRTDTKAIWLWQAAEVLNHRAQRTELLSFCRSNQVNHIFLSINRQLAGALPHDPRIAAFIAKLHADNIKVSALLGEASWILEKNRHKLHKRVADLLAYNRLAAPEMRFDAIHLDIEPHLLPDWKERREVLLADYLAVLEIVRQNTSGIIPLEVDIPAFYNKMDDAILAKIVDYADAIIIMAYARRTPAKVRSSLDNLARHLAEADKPMVIGLNSKDFESRFQLEHLIEQIAAVQDTESGFEKFAIHDYHNFKQLVEK